MQKTLKYDKPTFASQIQQIQRDQNKKIKPQIPIRNQSRVFSDEADVKQYEQFFQEVQQQLSQFDIRKLDPQLLRYHNVRLMESQQQQVFATGNLRDFYAVVQGTTYSETSYIYRVILKPFVFTIYLLNLHRESDFGNDIIYNRLGSGGFGQVNKVTLGGQNIAVKKIRFTQSQTGNPFDITDRAQRSLIRITIRQYAIYKLCSMLGIGAKVLFTDTHDIVCYNDCIQFQMDLCKVPYHDKQILWQNRNFARNLKYNVGILHKLKLVHKDIKPENILYDSQYNKYLLADFGLSHFIKEQYNQKSVTAFQGTLQFMSPEMRKLFSYPKKIDHANLYYNDFYALKKTVQFFQELKKKTPFTAQSDQSIEAHQISKNSMELNSEDLQYFSQSNQNNTGNIENQTVLNGSIGLEGEIGNTGSTYGTHSYEQRKKFCCQINSYENRVLFYLFYHQPVLNQQAINKATKKILNQTENEEVKAAVKNQIEQILFQVQKSKYSKNLVIRNSVRHYGLFSEQVVALLKSQIYVSESRNKQMSEANREIYKEDRFNFNLNFYKQLLGRISGNISEDKYVDDNEMKLMNILGSYKSQFQNHKYQLRKLQTLRRQNQTQEEQMAVKIINSYSRFLVMGQPRLSQRYSSLQQINQTLYKFSTYQPPKAYKKLEQAKSQVLNNFKVFRRITTVQQKIVQRSLKVFLADLKKYCNQYRIIVTNVAFKRINFQAQIDQIFKLQQISRQIYQCQAQNLTHFQKLLVSDALSKLIISKVGTFAQGDKLKVQESQAIKCKIFQIARFWLYQMQRLIEQIKKQQSQKFTIEQSRSLLQSIQMSQFKNTIDLLIFEQKFQQVTVKVKQLQFLARTYSKQNRSIAQAVSFSRQFWCQFKDKRIKEAADLLKQSRTIVLKLNGEQKYYSFLLQIENNLAKVYEMQGKLEQAFEIVRNIFQRMVLFEEKFGVNILYVVRVLCVLTFRMERPIAQIKQYIKIFFEASNYHLFYSGKKFCQLFKNSQVVMKLFAFSDPNFKQVSEQYLINVRKHLIKETRRYLPGLFYYHQVLCEQLAKYYYQKKLYKSFVRYLWRYFQFKDLNCLTTQDFHKFYLLVNHIIKVKEQNRNQIALRQLKRFIYRIPDQMFDLRSKAYTMMAKLHLNTASQQAYYFKIISEKKIFEDRDFEYVISDVNKKYGNNKFFQAMIKKKLKMI